MIIGITGPAGSGKSTASLHMASHLDCLHVNLDHVGHDLLRQPLIIEEIISKFGTKIVSNNEIDRKKLGKIVFSNPGDLETLNTIMFPKLRDWVSTNLIQPYQKNSINHVILEGAIIDEAEISPICDEVIAIIADNHHLQLFSPDKAHIRAIQRRKKSYSDRAHVTIKNTFNDKFSDTCIATIKSILTGV